nr:hypothetical protein GZ31B6_29 [uncultured archaeon GZfos31B6]
MVFFAASKHIRMIHHQELEKLWLPWQEGYRMCECGYSHNKIRVVPPPFSASL